MRLGPGTKLGHYEVGALIGVGGMGEVYRARDTKLKREVAIKVLPESFADDPARMARFQREAEVLASLNHPNIATIHGVEEGALAMELVEGETLAGPLPLETALNYGRQVAEALEYAHDRGVIHRDLKPANIKITPDGIVKLLDFGLAKATEDPATPLDPSTSPTLTLGATRVGMIIGTAAYMSPEQASGKAADRRSDIWSFGAVMFEMLSGKQAFPGESVSDTLASVLKLDPDWNALPPSTPRSIRNLVRRCLIKDRKQRLQAIGEARIIIADPAASEEPQAAVSARRLPWVIGAAVASLVALIATFGWWRASRPPAPAHLMNINFDLGPDAALDNGMPVILSADGTRMVYLSRGTGGKTQLSMRLLDQSAATVLRGTEGATRPFFSPDGNWVGFAADGKLQKISISGGRAITLCDAPNFRGASWGENGVIVAALQNAGELSIVNENGGNPTPLLSTAHGLRQRAPQVLPGGKAVIFTDTAFDADWDNGTIQAVSLEDLKPKVLINGGYFGRYVPSGNRSGGHLVYMSHGTLWAVLLDPGRLEVSGTATPLLDDVGASSEGGAASFDFSRTGIFVYVSGTATRVPRSLASVDASGKVQQLIASYELVGYAEPRVSPDGKRFAFRARDAIWIYDLERNTQSRLTLFQPPISFLVWTPDGSHIAFASDAEGKQGIWWVRADGKGEPEQLTQSKNQQHPTSFSRDGKRMAFTETNPDTGNDVWLMPIDWTDLEKPKPGKAEPFLHAKFDEDGAAFSPDGRWMAYFSNESGKFEVFVKSVTGSGKWPIATGSFPVWSRNGRELFWEVPQPNPSLMVVDYSTKADSFVPSKPRVWSDKRRIRVPNKQDFDLAPDGTRMFFVLDPRQQEPKSANGSPSPSSPTHVNLLLNFFDEIKRRAPAEGDKTRDK